MRSGSGRVLLSLAALALAASPIAAPASALASSGVPASGKGKVVEVALMDDLPATVILSGLLLGFVGLQDDLTASHCGWCSGPGSFDTAARKGLLAGDPRAASKGSDALLYGAMPAAAITAAILGAKRSHESMLVAGQDLVIVIESFLATALLTQWVKMIVRRPRPYAHFGGDDPLYAMGSDSLLGFFSGHTSLAASLAASTATLAFLRGRKAAPWIAVVGGAMAMAVGLLRVAADKHYMSDVLAGFAAGAAMGILVPILHVKGLERQGKKEKVAHVPVLVSVGAGCVSVSGSF